MHFGRSSPANPARIVPEPLSMTIGALWRVSVISLSRSGRSLRPRIRLRGEGGRDTVFLSAPLLVAGQRDSTKKERLKSVGWRR